MTDCAENSMPSEEEVTRFLIAESKPYEFKFVREQPLRVDNKNRIIFVDKDVLIKGVEHDIAQGFDWKQVISQVIKHEKAHALFGRWEYKWGVGSMDLGGIPNVLQDLMIDKMHFANDKTYQRTLANTSRDAYKMTVKMIHRIFESIDDIPHVFYNQAAYWATLGIITLKEAADLYPERSAYLVEIIQLFSKIKKEDDLEWAFPRARSIYLQHFKCLDPGKTRDSGISG